MAYQPKSYKKFVATAATATLVASAIAPVASAAFSDVAEQYKTAVDYLSTKGISQGYPNGKFGTDDKIKRQDAAVMIAKALGASPTGTYANAGFTDVPKDRQWAVNFLVEKKIVSGKTAEKFGANDFTTRGEMSKIIANAYKFVGDATNAFPFTDVSDTFKQYVDALNEAGVAKGLTATKFGTGDQVTRGQFALFVYRAETHTPANPEVVSVSAINAKQVTVTFNKAIDEDSVITNAGTNDSLTSAISLVANTDAETITASNLEGSLSKDGKTLTITNTSTTEFFDGDYTVTVDGAKDLAGTEVEVFITKLSVDDAVAPTVTGVEYDAATDLVTVSLSEAIVANPDVLRVNDSPVALTNSPTAPVTELTFARPASVTTGSTATIYIAGAKDFNGNGLVAHNGSLTFTKDASALGVSYSQVDSDTLRLQFNKKLGAKGATTLADLASAVTLLANGATFTDYAIVAAPGDTTGTKFDVNFVSSTLYGTAANEDLTILLAKNGLVDVYGNTNSATTSTFKMVKDVVAPTVAGTSVSTDKKTMTVAFNEGVAVTADTKFVVRRDGIATTGLTIVSDVKDSKKVNITKADGTAFVAGTYSIRVEAGAVKDLVEGNANALTTATASVTSGTSTTTNLVAAVSTGAAKNSFEVSFSDNGTAKEVTSAALNASNYKLDGKALPANTDIYFKDSSKQIVVITLPTGSVNIGKVGTGSNAILSVSSVKSNDGKTVVSTTGTVSVEDNTAATLTSAAKSGNSVITTFSEAVSGTNLTSDDFVLTTSTGTTVPSADYSVATVAGNSKQVQITFTAIPAGAITVKTAATVDLTDSNLLEVAAGSQVVTN